MKAWKVTEAGWPKMVSIVAAPTRGQAMSHVHRSKDDAGWPSEFINFRAVRAPEYDKYVDKVQTLGWREGSTSFGCLSPDGGYHEGR